MSYTTRLLDVIPVRNRIILGSMVALFTVSAIVDSVSSRPARSAHPPIVIIVATPTLPTARATGLAKEAAPFMVRAVSTAAPLPTVAIATPAPQQIEVSQVVAQPEPTQQRRVGERPSTKQGPPRP